MILRRIKEQFSREYHLFRNGKTNYPSLRGLLCQKFSEVNKLHGFDIIALSPHKKLNTKRSGRSSGGILVAVKRSLTQYFCLVKQTSDYMGKNS